MRPPLRTTFERFQRFRNPDASAERGADRLGNGFIQTALMGIAALAASSASLLAQMPAHPIAIRVDPLSAMGALQLGG
jgi:hypothetical protein